MLKDTHTIEEALTHADKAREELPHVIQVSPYDWDIVVLADEVKRLKARIEGRLTER